MQLRVHWHQILGTGDVRMDVRMDAPCVRQPGSGNPCGQSQKDQVVQ